MRKALLIVSICFATASFAEKNGSCTDSCTQDGKGKDFLKDLSMLKQPSSGSGLIDIKKWLANEEPKWNRWCNVGNTDPAGPGGEETPGNLHWCTKYCLGEGGKWTKLTNKDRPEKVKAFTEKRKKECGDLKAGVDNVKVQLKKTIEANQEKMSPKK